MRNLHGDLRNNSYRPTGPLIGGPGPILGGPIDARTAQELRESLIARGIVLPSTPEERSLAPDWVLKRLEGKRRG